MISLSVNNVRRLLWTQNQVAKSKPILWLETQLSSWYINWWPKKTKTKEPKEKKKLANCQEKGSQLEPTHDAQQLSLSFFLKCVSCTLVEIFCIQLSLIVKDQIYNSSRY